MPLPECTFYLNNEKYIYASCQCTDGRVSASIGKTTDKIAWQKGDLPKDVANRVRRIKYVVDEYIIKNDLANKPLLVADVEAIINIELVHKKTFQPKDERGTFIDEFERYTLMIETGDIKHNGKRYTESTVRQFYGIISHLKKIPKTGEKYIDTLTETDIKAIQSRIIDNDKSQNTLSVYTTQIRTFLKRTNGMGWHSNLLGDKRGISISQEDIDTKIYCSMDRISEIWHSDKPKRDLIEVRDSFVFGCQIGQRLSDCLKLNGHCRNGEYIELGTKKKGNAVVIPINSLALEIWDKYSGKVPFCNDYSLNLKRLFRTLEYDEPRLYSYTHGGVKTPEYYPYWKLVGSHIMRRSFATNAFLAGIHPLSIMPITGHKTIKSFMKYICIDTEQNATIMKQHPFFK